MNPLLIILGILTGHGAWELTVYLLRLPTRWRRRGHRDAQIVALEQVKKAQVIFDVGLNVPPESRGLYEVGVKEIFPKARFNDTQVSL